MRTRSVLALAAASLLLAPAASAYKLLGKTWDVDNGPIPYRLSEAGSDDISDGSDLEAVRSAYRSWECLDGVAIRFLEEDTPGPDTLVSEDLINSVLWDEDGHSGLIGPGTLGVTLIPGGPEAGEIFEADIVFNGVDTTWSTDSSATGETDVESVAVHEIGHFIGFGHPCTDEGETDCLGPDQSVMTPALPPGAVIRDPFQDDIDGALEMYPQAEDDESTCEGPFKLGQPCSCNDECVSGLKCSLDEVLGFPVCSDGCTASAAACPTGYACVLAAAEGDQDAQGACVAADEQGLVPVAATCERDSDCQQGLCLATGVVGRRICQVSCDGDGDCPDGYSCTEGICTGGGASSGIACAEPDPEPDTGDGCACARPGQRWPVGVALLGGWALVSLSRRRTRQR